MFCLLNPHVPLSPASAPWRPFKNLSRAEPVELWSHLFSKVIAKLVYNPMVYRWYIKRLKQTPVNSTLVECYCHMFFWGLLWIQFKTTFSMIKSSFPCGKPNKPPVCDVLHSTHFNDQTSGRTWCQHLWGSYCRRPLQTRFFVAIWDHMLWAKNMMNNIYIYMI